MKKLRRPGARRLAEHGPARQWTAQRRPFELRLGAALMGLMLAVSLVAGGCQAPRPGDAESASPAAPESAASLAATSSQTPLFEQIQDRVGLHFVHRNGSRDLFSPVEILGAGGAMVDVDNDGDLDVYLLQGGVYDRAPATHSRPVVPASADEPGDRLFRNLLAETGELRFEAIDDLPVSGYGMGIAVGDIDNDGLADLYVTRFGDNQLLRNLGGGRFDDVTLSSRTGDSGWSVPAAFFDADGDGWLDLYIGNYVDFDPTNAPPCFDLTGALEYCGPARFPYSADRLLRNLGDGTFEDITGTAWPEADKRPSLGVVAADVDRDGRIDLYVANDAEPNNLWINRGGGRFEDMALLAGSAVNGRGRAEGSMGVDAGDVDGDGDLDLFATHLTRESNTLYINNGRGEFEDRTAASGLSAPSQAFTSFGTAFFDYDLDGWLDLLVVSGTIQKIPELVEAGDPFPLHQPNQLFKNNGGVFEDVTATAGEVFELSEVSRGAAFGDIDNDGDPDVLVTNNNGPARLLRNLAGDGAPWVGLRLVVATRGAVRDVPGAEASLLMGDQLADARGEHRRRERHRRVRMEGSFASASDPRVVLPLDGIEISDAGVIVRVRWPDGTLEDFSGLEAQRYHTLTRGGGTAAAAPSQAS